MLLKECQDIQIRCGGTSLSASITGVEDDIYVSDPSGQVSNLLLQIIIINNSLHPYKVIDIIMQMTFRDINGLVEQNVKLQSQVQRLSAELEKRDEELKVSICVFPFPFSWDSSGMSFQEVLVTEIFTLELCRRVSKLKCKN